jgi:hypothetical protein
MNGDQGIQFLTKGGPVPDNHFDNEVPVKKNPDDCYSKKFVESNKRRLQDLKARSNNRVSID